MLPAVDFRYGTLSVPLSTYRSLNPAIAKRALSVWMKYIGGTSDVRNILPLHQLLLTQDRATNVTKSRIIMAVEPEQKKLSIARRLPDRKSQAKSLVPIRVGETVLWDNRFQISLLPQQRKENESQEQEKLPSESQEFYIRHLSPADWQYMSRGAVKVKHPVYARGGLPVIVDREGKIVVIPHFKLRSREENLFGRVKFTPIRSLDVLLQYSYYHSNE